ncbi:acetate--CoA ligase family protein [Elioraea rosea]|uniref:acetate--CoA ligase family protein n=1 Tax=Elioraea rosea TaxID=2492390 RepID=UPI0019511238|nr:acetate--CoA ligase family protein [Elioraea rosea]
MTHDPLLSPSSVAIVGASDDAAKPASRPLRFLRAGGYRGRVYPVARRETVLGERAWPGLEALPERPDHAFILLPADAAVDAVGDCVRLGIPAVTLLTGGFGEAGAEGEAREKRLRAVLAGGGTRILGPNSIGLANLDAGVVLTANAAFAEPNLPRGGLFVASQSGSMIGAIMSRGAAKGLGFAALVSVGAELDLTIGEICARSIDDSAVTGYMLFLETIRGADQLRRFAVAAAAKGKPVVAYKLGRSEAAAELAQSHTGALAGDDDLADAFLRDCGIARVETLEGFLEAPALLGRLAIRPRGARPPAVGVVTTTGGGAAMIVDQLGLRGVTVAAPSGETRARLAASGVGQDGGRILDLTLAGAQYPLMKAALDAMRSAPEYDLVVAVAGSSARFQPEIAVRPVVDAARESGAPLAAFCVPEAPAALAALSEAGVPAFRTPEACADAVAAAFARRPPRMVSATPLPQGAMRSLDEWEAYQVLARAGVPHAPAVVMPLDQRAAAKLPFAWPVAVKALDARLAHKSDVGGVVLGVASPAALAGAAQRIAASVADHRPDIVLERVLVQQMTPALGEALVGYRNDPALGPIVLLAAGGVNTEVLRDRSVRPAPVDRAMAVEMIGEVRAFAMLAGFRGGARGDIAALADVVVAMSRLGDLPGIAIAECEVNPLLIGAEGEGAVAVDAVMRVVEPD